MDEVYGPDRTSWQRRTQHRTRVYSLRIEEDGGEEDEQID